MFGRGKSRREIKAIKAKENQGGKDLKKEEEIRENLLRINQQEADLIVEFAEGKMLPKDLMQKYGTLEVERLQNSFALAGHGEIKVEKPKEC